MMTSNGLMFVSSGVDMLSNGGILDQCLDGGSLQESRHVHSLLPIMSSIIFRGYLENSLESAPRLPSLSIIFFEHLFFINNWMSRR
jgi:hypothetical protein